MKNNLTECAPEIMAAVAENAAYRRKPDGGRE